MIDDEYLKSLRTFKIDTQRGIYETDGSAEDASALFKAMELLKDMPAPQPAPQPQVIQQPIQQQPQQVAGRQLQTQGLTITQALSKYLIVKKLEQATYDSYKHTIEEFAGFTKNQLVVNTLKSDVANYIEYLLGTVKNSHRTVQNKIGTIKTFFNFCISKGYYFEENPTLGQDVLTKKQRTKGSFAIFTNDEVVSLFTHNLFDVRTKKDKDFYYACLITLITGMRVGEITTLKKSSLKEEDGINYIKLFDSKTEAGKRDVPLPKCQLVDDFLEYAKQSKQPDDKIFRYKERDGKGAGNALGKKFGRLLEETKVKREKMVFHSLRKYFNNYLKKKKVMWEMRTQVIGHENDDVNNDVYSDQFTIKEVADRIEPLQIEILELINIK